jgi:site-specific DNA-cytosine methylase
MDSQLKYPEVKTIFSLFDYTGNWSRPYKEAGFNVIQIDIKHGQDILTFEYQLYNHVYGILAAIPCTDYALSGARWFKEKDIDGRTEESNKLVRKTIEIIKYFKPVFWVIENPMSRIHTCNPELGKPVFKFDPCEFAGYDPIHVDSQYRKRTWLWGLFNKPEYKYLPPLLDYNPGWKKYGGKSERTKELRSITPLGFAYAFFGANH